MSPRPRHELAEVFQKYREGLTHEGSVPAWSWEQRAVVEAITACRTARLGGHVDACDGCGYRRISYNSCRNRHCPKCQGSAQADWLKARQAEVLHVPYAHVVFTVPQILAPLALQNPRVVYGLLLRTVGRTLQDVALNPKHLGARIGFFAVLHTWGQTLVHHPHVHCVVPAGGLAEDGCTWRPCRPGFFLPVRVLSRLFRGKFIAGLWEAFQDGNLEFHGALARYRSRAAFARYLKEACRTEWVVYAKPPFDGPKHVLEYLARYTHRVAISNHRLLDVDDTSVRFRYQDYRSRRFRTLTLPIHEFTRRFLLHVVPKGFVRIRYSGLFANANRARLLDCSRQALGQPAVPQRPEPRSESESRDVDEVLIGPVLALHVCPGCGQGVLRCVQILGRPPPPTQGYRRAAS